MGKHTIDTAPGRRLLLCLPLLTFAFLLLWDAQSLPGFGEWYALRVYPLIVRTLGRVSGLLPFSLSELLLYVLLFEFVYFLFRKKNWKRFFSGFVLTASLLYFLFVACCGVNYYRIPFSQEISLYPVRSTREELNSLTGYLAEEIKALWEEEGDAAPRLLETPENAPETAREAMILLSGKYPCLAGFYPKPKLVGVSYLLSVQQVTGVYSPFTVEANVNREMTAYNLPFTMCHELSHLRGFMREDEANFIAFLACLRSPDRAFRMSGLMMGYLYASNELFKEDRAAWETWNEIIPRPVRDAYEENNAFWARFDSPAADLHEAVNDAYLKSNGQTDGVKSYGRVLDLMLAWNRQRQRPEESTFIILPETERFS